MGLFGKKTGEGLGLFGTLAGLALVSHLFDSSEKETRVVHEYVDTRAEQEEERREREHQRKLEMARKKEETGNPNRMEFVNERIDKGIDTSLLGTGAFCVFDLALLFGLGWSHEGWLSSYALYAIGLIALGLLLTKLYFEKKKERDIYKKYAELILVQGYRNIMEIANYMHCSYEESVEKISKIITRGYIRDFCIDRNRRMVVSNDYVNNKSINENANALKNNQSSPRVGKNCGGNQFVVSKEGICCKYCGGMV